MLVVSGGPGGIRAAEFASIRGHRVTVFEEKGKEDTA
jgi:NADPH-dependent 2,4-dienoyl-CoA reductase/sulfur reductase-like enzyme